MRQQQLLSRSQSLVCDAGSEVMATSTINEIPTVNVSQVTGVLSAGNGGTGATSLGSSLSVVANVLNTIQGIRTADSPQFTALSLSTDVVIQRDGANILALKNGANAQELRVYGMVAGGVFAYLKSDGANGSFGISGASGLYLELNGGGSGLSPAVEIIHLNQFPTTHLILDPLQNTFELDILEHRFFHQSLILVAQLRVFLNWFAMRLSWT